MINSKTILALSVAGAVSTQGVTLSTNPDKNGDEPTRNWEVSAQGGPSFASGNFEYTSHSGTGREQPELPER